MRPCGGNAGGSEGRQGGGAVLESELLDEFKRKGIAIERFRGRRAEIGMAQVLPDTIVVHAAAGGKRATLVMGASVAAQHPVVDEGIAGPCIEGDKLAAAAGPGDVGEAADVEDGDRRRG